LNWGTGKQSTATQIVLRAMLGEEPPFSQHLPVSVHHSIRRWSPRVDWLVFLED